MLEDQNKELNRKAYDETWEALKAADEIVVPGGFDKRGVEGKILCCKYARENKIPFLGTCLGMQCAAIEFARNVCGIAGANSTEFAKDLTDRQQIVIDMPEHDIEKKGLGGTMRLGKRTTAFLTDNSVLCKLYEHELAEERHRHRYEINPNIVPELSSKGLLFVGMGVDETNTSFLQNRRTQSSQALMNMAEQHDDDLLAKISNLCLREGGDGITRPAVRMEIIEILLRGSSVPPGIHLFPSEAEPSVPRSDVGCQRTAGALPEGGKGTQSDGRPSRNKSRDLDSPRFNLPSSNRHTRIKQPESTAQ